MNVHMKWFRNVAAISAVLIVGLFGLTACELTANPSAAAQDATTEGAKQTEPGIRYEGAEVLIVELDREIVRPDARGQERAWNRAFMVRLRISEPPAPGPAFHIYLDGERVPEYGGWEEGIYFWVYDPDQLRSLDGATVSYTFSRSERLDVGTLNIGDPAEYRSVSKREIFGKTP